MMSESMIRRETPLREGSSMGTRFGKYRLLQRLAVGGMAQLYIAAIDGPDGFSKLCVVKRILPEYSNLPDFARMFVTEAKVAALLNHPQIVQVFDFGRVGDDYYIAMEYVDGASLDDLMTRAPEAGVTLGVRAAVNIGMQLCEALAYAHTATLPNGQSLNLVHRDVTPGNVLISHSGIVKLTDFGIVRVTQDDRYTAVGVVKGKFAYASPEQIRSEPLDKRSDIFALGIILYEISTGCWLFRRPEAAATIMAVSEAQVRPPTSIAADYPPQLERILLKALSKSPGDRYADARELLSDLEGFRNSQNWTSGSRELESLMHQVFPNGRRHTIDAAALENLGDHVPDDSGGDALVLDEADIVEEGRHGAEEPGVKWVNLVALVLGVIGTIVFWLTVLK